jgi:putative nucleotidyltransferase with HDIG domain
VADIRQAQKRERQLDAISEILVLGLLLTLSMTVYYLSSTALPLIPSRFFSDNTLRVLMAGFVLIVLLYLADQRRRLRKQVIDSLAEIEAARSELDETVRWLGFSHAAASRLGTEGLSVGLIHVLTDAAKLFKADAAAVIGEDLEAAYVSEAVPEDEAWRALMSIGLEAAGRSDPLLMKTVGSNGGAAIAVPLRVAGELRFVLGVWRRNSAFEAEQLTSLGLMGRMIEMALEREESLEEAQSQLEGTLSVLQFLVADKRPDYSQHAMRVAELASGIGREMGLPQRVRKELRLAGLVHDVGILNMPRDMGNANRSLTHEEMLIMQQHPRIGAEIADAANFDPVVHEAVCGHHERLDGSGYPNKLRGDQIPLTARILAVCEVWDSMTHRTYHGDSDDIANAEDELRDNAGSLYDARVVETLLSKVVDAEGTELHIAELTSAEGVHAS